MDNLKIAGKDNLSNGQLRFGKMMRKKEVTETQRQVYIVIDEWWKKFGFGPSLEDVMAVTGDKSKGNVCRKMKKLVELGLCKQIPGRHRSIRPAYLKVRDII